jgi:hypothetical protein
MVSFERLFEVLDLEPMIKESPNAVVMPDGPAFDLRPRRLLLPRGQEVSLASLEAVARLDDTPRTDVLHDVSFRVIPGTMTAWWAQRRRQDDHLDAGLAPLRRRPRFDHHQRVDVRERRRRRSTPWSASSPRTRTSSTTPCAPT